jgi:hypothetical protein
MVGGWGVGKTMCAIFRAVLYSKLIPNNLGIIFRKTFRSLEDSTLKDFEKYTGIKVPSNRDYVYPNGSTIMFRHLDEMESINQQNINLGWYFIEQGEELDSDKEFYMLFGRLRRNVDPSPEFLSTGLSPRSGWIIANAGDNWIKKLWKDGKIQAAATELGDEAKNLSELIEAVTWDNKENLPKDFLDSLKVIERTKPEIYKQFVMNDWSVGFKNKLFSGWLIDQMKARQGLLSRHSANAGVSVDPAGDGADDNVIMGGKGGEVLEVFTQTSMSPSDRAHKSIQMCRRIGGAFIIVDCDGVGIDTWQELNALSEDYTKGIEFIKFHGSAKSDVMECERRMYANIRAEAHFAARKRAQLGKAGIDVYDTELIEDLAEPEFFTNNQGLIQIEKKEDIKERLGRSPGRGDAYIMLQYAFDMDIKGDTRAYESTRERLPSYGLADDTSLGSSRQELPAYGIID